MECLNISSIEPSVISPPCMCAMGTLLKTAATTDEKISYLSPKTKTKSGLFFLNK